MIVRASRDIRERLTRSDWATLAGMAAVVIGLHACGFLLLFACVVPAHLRLGASGVFGVGIGITAYTLGLRHAFDADHIGAIDNTTRKLMQDGQRPLSTLKEKSAAVIRRALASEVAAKSLRISS